MAYSKTTWTNGVTPINETNLNKIENQLEILSSTETVTNANGSAIKHPDGTMICYKAITITATIGNVWGSWYETASQVEFGNFPVAFKSTPVIAIQPVGSACWVEAINSVSTTSCGKGYLARPVSASSADYTFYIIAIGRWK